MNLRSDADGIIQETLAEILPDAAVEKALRGHTFGAGRVVLIAVGKAAWQMAHAAADVLGERIDTGLVITKYGHVMGEIPRIRCVEAGHPVPDENSLAATVEALALTENLTAEDTVLFLLSGGGSALFEQPLIPPAELTALTEHLLASGASIVEMNTIRKRMSAVKGGRFGAHCAPAHVFSIVLSDILGDPLDMIASGPAHPDTSTAEDAHAVVQKYGLHLSKEAAALLDAPLPTALPNVETHITGSVRELCAAAARAAERRGYTPVLLTDQLDTEARAAGQFLACIARTHAGDGTSYAYIAGGETIVQLVGKGRGGRNQELALAAADGIAGRDNIAVFSIGSDGTDGPTDAAGGYVDGGTAAALARTGMNAATALAENDSYTALNAVDGLIITGPTGTNVNDVAVVLIRG
ncbi:MAG: glycerate kinase [Selenomonas massiliensis]